MKRIIAALTFSLAASTSWAGLKPMADNELGQVDGEGVAAIFEDFEYVSGNPLGTSASLDNNLEISGIETSDGDPVKIHFPGIYIGSDPSAPVGTGTVNIGRLKYPLIVGVLDGDSIDGEYGDNRSVFQISMPEKLALNHADGEHCIAGNDQFGFCSSRTGMERPTILLKSVLEVNNSSELYLSSRIDNLALDGSRIRFWGEGDDRLTFDLRLNAYAQRITLDDYRVTTDTPTVLSDVAIELALGYGTHQPVTFEVVDGGHFRFEVRSLENIAKNQCDSISATGGCVGGQGATILQDFYDNGPASNVFVGNVNISGTDLGTSTIENLQIQYLEVTSHDL